jgi:lipoprotein-releasing system ATP-binding protein
LVEVDLALEAGQVAAVMGPSGSGKSTLLYVLGGLLKPDRGEVWLANESLWELSPLLLARKRNRDLGFVFQHSGLLPDFTALENVCVPGWIAGRSRRWCTERARTLLDRVGLGDRADHFPVQLSGGEQQRVAICRAVLLEPLLLLADEPTGSLDRETAASVVDLLFEVARDGERALLVVTHNPALAERCGTILKLERGRLERVDGQLASQRGGPDRV